MEQKDYDEFKIQFQLFSNSKIIPIQFLSLYFPVETLFYQFKPWLKFGGKKRISREMKLKNLKKHKEK